MTTLTLQQRSERPTPEGSRRAARIGATVGVEIGYNALYLVRLREASDGAIIFDDCRTVAFDPVLELESSEFATVLKAALKEFCGSSRDVAIWAAPKQDRARLHHVQVPPMNASRLSGAVYWALKREEPFLDDETVVDFSVEGETAPAAGSNQRVTGVLAARADIEGIQRAFSHAGFPLAGISLPLFALRNLVNLRSRTAPEAPVLLCQMGLNATSVSVLLGRRLVFSRSIPVGLRSLAETLVKELHPAPSNAQASNLVLELGRENGALPADRPWAQEDVFLILRPALERMVRQIERTIQYYQSNYNSDPIETIFLGGEIAARGPVSEFISEQISGEVIVLDPFDTPQLQAKTARPAAPAERIAYGPAFGLALAANGASLNLARTYKDRENERRRRGIASAVFAFLVFLSLVAGGFYAWQQTQLRGLRAERDQLTRSLEALGPKLSEPVILAALQDVRALQERRKAAAKRYEGLALLSEVAAVTPENISLLRVAAEMGSPIRTEPAKGKTDAAKGSSLRLEGVVTGERASLETSLAIYLARLSQSPLFQSVEVDSTELVPGAGGLHLAFALKLESESDKKATAVEQKK
jgi:type IV pilus assembly protein PilM